MPAASATWAEGKSWAVSIVMGSFLAWRVRRVWIVVFLRGFEEGEPRGEWDECRVWRWVAAAARRGVMRRVGWVEDAREDRRSVDGRVRRDAIVFCGWAEIRVVLVGIFGGMWEGENGRVYKRERRGPC